MPSRSIELCDAKLEPASTHVRRCALVSTSGDLLLHRDGERIDHYDMVLRLGQAPVHGYEPHIGRRTDVRVMAGSVFQDWRWNRSSDRDGILQRLLGTSSERVLVLQGPTAEAVLTPSRLGLDATFEFVRGEGLSALSCGRHSAAAIHLTTGLKALLLSFSPLVNCTSTTLFGFLDQDPRAAYHYFRDGRVDGSESSNVSRWFEDRRARGYHDFAKEHRVMRLLINASGGASMRTIHKSTFHAKCTCGWRRPVVTVTSHPQARRRDVAQRGAMLLRHGGLSLWSEVALLVVLTPLLCAGMYGVAVVIVDVTRGAISLLRAQCGNRVLSQ